MRYITVTNVLLMVSVMLSMGCRMSMDQYNAWERYMLRDDAVLRQKIEAKQKEIEVLKEKKAQKEAEKAFLIGKTKVISMENATLNETWDGMNNDSHEVMMNLFSRIHDSEKAFYDVRLGNPPMAMSSTLSSDKYTLLVDMENLVREDCSIQSAEIFASRKAPVGVYGKVCFVVLSKNETGNDYIRSFTSFFLINTTGLNKYSFTDSPLDAKKGDKYGIILSPGASIDYEALDTGRVCLREFDSVPDMLGKLKFSLEIPSLRGASGLGAREIALMVRGTSHRKSLFLVDEPHKFAGSKILSKAIVSITSADDIPMPVYVALLNKEGNAGFYIIRDISPMTMVKPGESKEIKLEHNQASDGHQTFLAKPGDICALLIPGVSDETMVKGDIGIYKAIASFDYSKPSFRKRLEDMKRETSETKDAKSGLISVSFRVE